MRNGEHHYNAHLVWEGNRGAGTSHYTTYGRGHTVAIEGKPPLHLTADPAFRGEAETLNPEDLFVSAVASCHMLSYLALCAREKLVVTAYEDAAEGTMKEDGKGGGRFTEVILHPRVTITDASRRERALELHEKAHEQCFIASSCIMPIRHHASVVVAGEANA